MKPSQPAALFLLVVASVLASACGTTRFSVTRRAPAEVDIPAGKVIAVAALPGNGGEQLASDLTQALLETKRFQVLERQHLGAAMAELKFSAEGHVSDETAMSFGNMTGAATLVTGEVANTNYEEKVSSAQEQCSRPEGVVDCTHYTRVATAKLRVVLRVVETETGRVLAAKTLNALKQKSADAMDAEPPALGAERELLDECRGEVVAAFVRVVAPHDKQVLVALRSEDKLPELETGNNYAKIGNWGAAVDQYRAAVARSQSENLEPALQAMALYNLGIGLGYSGAFDEGVAEVEHAFALDPDDLYLEQAAVIRQFKEEAARLAAQEGQAPEAQPASL